MPPQRRRRHLGRALLIAALCEVVLLLGNVVASFLTEWTGDLSWLAAPTAAVLVALGKLLVEEFAAAAPDGAPAVEADHRERVELRPPRTPLALVLLTAVVVIGGTGYALTTGVRYATGYVTGNQSGVERLVAPRSTDAQGLSLAVDSVEHTAHFTRVHIVVTNRTSNTVSLPLFRSASLVSEDGASLEADPFRSDFAETVPSGGTRSGTLVFRGHVTDAPATVEVAFATVFAQGFDGPDSVTLSGLELRAVDG